jgi:hypothetical protein
MKNRSPLGTHFWISGTTLQPKSCKMAELSLITAACVADVISPSNSTGQVGARSTSVLSASSFLLKRSMNDGLERHVRKRSYWPTTSIVPRESCPPIHEFKLGTRLDIRSSLHDLVRVASRKSNLAKSPDIRAHLSHPIIQELP